MKKNKNRNWLYVFYKENILYVWIVIGILVVSGVSIGISLGNITNEKENNNLLNDVVVNVPEINKENVVINNEKDVAKNDVKESNNKNIETKKDIVKKEEDNKVVETISKNVVKEEKKTLKKLSFIMPVNGEVNKEFSADNLVYSLTLEQWTSHLGIDILADMATPVKSIEDGIISDIKEDPRYGNIIIIDHGQGYESIYSNLSTLDMAFIGKNVEKGQVISGVGKTALFEVNDESHLHFELVYNNKKVNPLEHIKK